MACKIGIYLEAYYKIKDFNSKVLILGSFYLQDFGIILIL